MILVQVAVSFLIRKKSERINGQIQSIISETQNKLQAYQNQFMRKPVSQKQMIAVCEREQNDGYNRILKVLDSYIPLYKWNFMLKKQVNTMRMMFLYQQKKYKEVDALLPQCLFFDSQSISMKMARMYMNQDSGLDKFFQKKCKRMKGENVVLPYSLYAWILVKQNRVDEAVKVLNTAKERCTNEVIVKNWEMLVNGKIKHFSNSQLGDIWYSLALETPKIPKMQQQVRYR